MKKLEPEKVRKLNEMVDRLARAETRMDSLVERINAIINDELNTEISEYNETLTEANEFRNDLITRMNNYREEQTQEDENWEKSDEGENYTRWLESWDGLELDTIEPVDELELMEEAKIADDLAKLETEVQ